MQKGQKLTGYPSIDKPWLKYYSEEAINASLPEGSLYDYMLTENKERMNCVAVNYFGRKITYGQLDGQIRECAKALIARGVRPGDIVSICMLTVPEVLVLLYAINRIGAVCNFLAFNATDEEIHKHISSTGCKLLFSIDLAAEKIKKAVQGTSVEEVVVISPSASMPLPAAWAFKLKSCRKMSTEGMTDWKLFLRGGKETHTLPPESVCSDAMAVLEYTSGTTGESKGVMLSNRAINSVAFHYKNSSTVLDFHRGERFLCIIPPFLAFGLVAALIMPLCIGFQLILEPNPDSKSVTRSFVKYRPNHVMCSPLHIDSIIQCPQVKKMDLSFLSTLAYGGEKSDPTWEKKINEFIETRGARHSVSSGYGLTETASSFCTTTHRTKEMIPFVKNNVRIVDVDTDEELSYGQEGEVCVSGPSLMLGYYKHPKATEELFFEVDGTRWMRTGDLGFVVQDGFFHITGRIKRIFWRQGEDGGVYRVYPMKIEEVICQCDAVDHCAVVGRKNESKGYDPIAFVVKKDDTQSEQELAAAIRENCRKHLPANSQPSKIFFVKSLPMTRAGKIDYRFLEEKADNILD